MVGGGGKSEERMVEERYRKKEGRSSEVTEGRETKEGGRGWGGRKVEVGV
jgi:hypothetical protein